MPQPAKPKATKQSKAPHQTTRRYLENVSRRWVYGVLVVLAVVAIGLFLLVPHYKPLKIATQGEVNQAHEAIIKRYFLRSTICPAGDDLSHDERVKAFNKYFRVNQFANRAVIRGCNDADTLLAKGDDGRWQPTDVNIRLDTRQNPQWQKECLIDDITTADSVVRPENASIDAFNYDTCHALRRESFVEVNLSIHFHK